MVVVVTKNWKIISFWMGEKMIIEFCVRYYRADVSMTF